MENTYFAKFQSSLLSTKYLLNDNRALQEAAWLRSNSFHGSFRWANCSLADGCIGSRWSSVIFQAALQLRLLADLSTTAERLSCQFCNSGGSARPVTTSLHALSCNLTRGLRNIRHTSINHELQTLLKRIDRTIAIENEPVICEANGHVIRSDIRYIANGSPVIIDVGVACATAHISSANEFNSAYNECGAAEEMENVKRRKMEPFVDRGFHPFVVESSGRLGRTANLFLNRSCMNHKDLRTSFLYNISTIIAQESGRMLKFLRDKLSNY
jgi:hypothetical protein